MFESYFEPPEEPEIHECCDKEMDANENGDLICSVCGNLIPHNDWDIDILPDEEIDFDQIDTRQSTCPHGNEWGECGNCDHEGDLAYDAARERRVFGR